MTIVFMFLASALIVPVGMSYATYGSSPAFTPNPSTPTSAPPGNQTMTTPSPAPVNQTMTNMTMPATTTPSNKTMTNMTVSAPSTPVITSKTSLSQSLSPLKQFKSGVAAKSVQCPSGFSLVLKAEDSSPACVHSSSVQILIQRGWAAIQ